MPCASPQDKLYQPEYQEVSTEEQRDEIAGRLSAVSTWLEDEGFGATTAVRGVLGTAGGSEKAGGVGVRPCVHPLTPLASPARPPRC